MNDTGALAGQNPTGRLCRHVQRRLELFVDILSRPAPAPLPAPRLEPLFNILLPE